jgi:hypothetical protein
MGPYRLGASAGTADGGAGGVFGLLGIAMKHIRDIQAEPDSYATCFLMHSHVLHMCIHHVCRYCVLYFNCNHVTSCVTSRCAEPNIIYIYIYIYIYILTV